MSRPTTGMMFDRYPRARLLRISVVADCFLLFGPGSGTEDTTMELEGVCDHEHERHQTSEIRIQLTTHQSSGRGNSTQDLFRATKMCADGTLLAWRPNRRNWSAKEWNIAKYVR